MNYRQLQTELKAYRSEGFIVPPLNSPKAVLEAALNEIETGIIESGEISYHEMLSDNRTIEALERMTNFLADKVETISSQPVERVWKLEMMSLAKLRRYAKKQGIKHASTMRKAQLINALTA